MLIRGVSEGGVLIPEMPAVKEGGNYTEIESEGNKGPFQEFLNPYGTIKGAWGQVRELDGPEIGSPKLPEANAYYAGRPPVAWLYWCPTDIFTALYGSDALFVIPLVIRIAEIIAISYKLSSSPPTHEVAWLEPALPGAVSITIGFSPYEPTITAGGEFSYEDFEGGLPAGQSCKTDPFGGGVSYTLPVEWVGSDLPLDCMQVGRGNYNPARKRLVPAAGVMDPYSGIVGETGEYPPDGSKFQEQEALLEEFLNTIELWEAWERAEGKLRGWLKVHKPIVEALEKELEALKGEEPGTIIVGNQLRILAEEENRLEKAVLAASREFDEASTKLKYPQLPLIGDFARVGLNREMEELREKHGPYRLDVTNWCYRFKWDKPPGRLPNLATSNGYFIVEISAQAGTRWPYGGIQGFEVQTPNPVNPGQIAAGMPISGAVRS